MKIRLLPPAADLIDTIASAILDEAPDFSSLIIVFPEKRPGYYVRKALAQKLGHGLLPPACFSLDDFIDFIYSEKLFRPDKKILPLEAVGLLFEIHQKSPVPLGGQAFLSFDQFFSLGLKLYQDLEELKHGQVSPEALRQADALIQLHLPPETSARLQTLSFFYENFYKEIEERGFSTPASRLNYILQNFSDQLFKEKRIILAGFFSLTRSEAELIRKVLSLDRAELYVLAGRGLEHFEKILGLSFKKDVLPPDSDQTEIKAELKFYLAPDVHGEIFALNREIEEKIKKPEELHERQVIVLPAAETLFPLFHQTLSSLPADAFNISLGYPLTRTPLYSFFDCLFDLIQTRDEENRFYLPSYLRFVLHPYTKNIYFPVFPRRSDFTRILFHLVEETLSRQRGSLFWSLEEIERNPELEKALIQYVAGNKEAPEEKVFLQHLHQIHLKTIYPFLELENLGSFARKLLELAEFMAQESTASLHAFFEPYFQAFLNLFEALEKSIIKSYRFEHLASYFNFFRKVMAEATVPFPGTPLRGLQILGFWETRCLPLEEVYLLDMNEGVIPASSRVDSLLPYAVRKAFGLPTYEELERRVEYYFDIVIRRARKVCLYFIENSEKEKSRLVERLLWERQKKERQPDPSSLIASVRYHMALSMPSPRPVAKSPALLAALRTFCFSVSALDNYLQCPLKFYYGSLLKLEEKEELAEPVEKKEIGTIVHSILENYFQPWKNRELRPEWLTEDALRKTMEREFMRAFGPSLSGSSFLLRQQIENHLLDFLRHYQLPLAREYAEQKRPYHLIDLERLVESEMKLDGEIFKVRIKIDRVERRDKDIFIIDYKTSAQEKNYEIRWSQLDPASRETWPEAISSLQLPFYTLVWAEKNQQKPEEIKAILLLLGKNRISRKEIEYWPFDEDPGRRREQFDLIFQVIKGLLLEIINPEIPFSSDLAREGSCRYCPYTALCGQ